MEFSTKEEADQAYAANPNDRQVYEAFSRFYERTYPGESEVGAVDPQLEKLFNEAGQSPQQQSEPSTQSPHTEWRPGVDAFDEAFEWSENKAGNHLRQELGADFDETLQTAKAVAQAVNSFPNQRFVQQFAAIMGNHPEGVKLLAHVYRELTKSEEE
jgi:hypothetical protein